jgi:hypothetical protein
MRGRSLARADGGIDILPMGTWAGRLRTRLRRAEEADATSDYESKLARRSYVVGRGGSPRRGVGPSGPEANRPVAIEVNRPYPYLAMILETIRLILRLFREEDFDLVANFGSWHRHVPMGHGLEAHATL